MTRENLALYRKYRPKSFKDVLGQDHIVRVLEQSAKKGDIVHAYLFSGSRGIGKTSLARIFAKSIGTADNDISEIDAASNRGIDDARELREAVSSLPFESLYKVYIIDEVHMLTKEAFNALLKTLEEPPSHVVFILATTEAHKLPDTIISRCQVFNFHRPTVSTVKELLQRVAKKEKIDLIGEASHLMALIADGSFRDALGTLQKVFSSTSSSRVTAKDVEEVTGAPSTTLINNLIEAMAEKDAEKGISVFSQVQKENYDSELFFERVLQKLRFLILMKNSPEMNEVIKKEVSNEEYEFLVEVIKKEFEFSLDDLQTFLEAKDLCRVSTIRVFPLEMAFLDVIKKGSIR